MVSTILASVVAICLANGDFKGLNRSANTPDFVNGINVINPDLSVLQSANIPRKHWKCDPGVAVIEMTTAEKAVVDTRRAARQSATDEINTLRAELDAFGGNYDNFTDVKKNAIQRRLWRIRFLESRQ